MGATCHDHLTNAIAQHQPVVLPSCEALHQRQTVRQTVVSALVHFKKKKSINKLLAVEQNLSVPD
jgi:hypothetical protein